MLKTWLRGARSAAARGLALGDPEISVCARCVDPAAASVSIASTASRWPSTWPTEPPGCCISTGSPASLAWRERSASGSRRETSSSTSARPSASSRSSRASPAGPTGRVVAFEPHPEARGVPVRDQRRQRGRSLPPRGGIRGRGARRVPRGIRQLLLW